MADVNTVALVDKLCERLAVETGSVAIYEAAIAKLDDPRVLPRLKRYMQDEANHCQLLINYLDTLGVRDRQTPSARLATLEGQAYLKLIGEAATPLQVINILLTIELTDESAWEMLLDFGRDLHDDEMVRTFDAALKTEKEHLRGVRGMVAQLTREGLIAVEPHITET